MKRPLVSVVIPVYNEEKYVRACLDSISRQSYPRKSIEVLAVEGGSTDRSREIISGYSRSHKFVKLVKSQEKGHEYDG